jgi:hypothetical protein
MAVSITYDEVRAAPAGQFDLTYTVTATTDIPEEIFLFNATTLEYERVCTPTDFGFPTAPDPLNAAFYRLSTVALSFVEFSAAELGQTHMRADIATLADDYQVGIDGWAGTDSITVP